MTGLGVKVDENLKVPDGVSNLTDFAQLAMISVLRVDASRNSKETVNVPATVGIGVLHYRFVSGFDNVDVGAPSIQYPI
jgi:hypothetical protein